MLGVGKVQTLRYDLCLWTFSKQFCVGVASRKLTFIACIAKAGKSQLLNKSCPGSDPVKIDVKWDPIAPTCSTLPRAALRI